MSLREGCCKQSLLVATSRNNPNVFNWFKSYRVLRCNSARQVRTEKTAQKTADVSGQERNASRRVPCLKLTWVSGGRVSSGELTVIMESFLKCPNIRYGWLNRKM